MEVGEYVNASRSMKITTNFKGSRQLVEKTHTATTAKPGETLYVELPKVQDKLIVPGTFAMTYDMDIILDPAEPGNVVNTYPVNNLAANIISRIVVKIDSEPIYDLDYAHLYNTYIDLWLTEQQRLNSVFKGIQNEELRKIRTDLGANLPNPSAENLALRNVHGKRYIIPLNFELITDHIPIPMDEIVNRVTFELTINRKEYVLKYVKEEADFKLNNIKIQYETLSNSDLYRENLRTLDSGFPFLFDHVHHYEKKGIGKKETLVNVGVAADRKSLKGILLIFQEDLKKGERDSEYFPNPEIEEIDVEIDNSPKALFNEGYKALHMWEEIYKHFVPEDFKKGYNTFMNMQKYYSDNKFAVWVDLRTTHDNRLHGTGKFNSAQKSVRMCIKKKNKGEGIYTMHIFLVSDARIKLKEKKFEKLEY